MGVRSQGGLPLLTDEMTSSLTRHGGGPNDVEECHVTGEVLSEVQMAECGILLALYDYYYSVILSLPPSLGAYG
jgi:hypothetical protein